MRVDGSSGRGFRALLIRVLTICLLLGAGCNRPPQIGQENRRLIASLRTAVTARKADWLDQNAKAIDDRHAAGSLSEDQYAAFQSIIEHARAGHWADAELEVVHLAKAQQPMTEDAETRARRGNSHR